MKYNNIIIKGIGVYHPKKEVQSEETIKYFENQGMEVRGLMDALGRKKRYMVDNDDENSLTMSVEASKEALKRANVHPDQLDMIVFVSDMAEYSTPPSSLFVNQALEAVNAHTIYDINGACTGGITALDQVCRFMKTNPDIKYALVTGGVMMSKLCRKDDPVFFGTWGDAASAVILENCVEDKKRGFIDSNYFTDSSYHFSIHFPACGLSHIYDKHIDEDKKKYDSEPFDFSFLSDEWYKLITKMLHKNELNVSDINHFIFSQFSITAIKETFEKLNVNMTDDRYTFVGDRYGYTGNTSPFIALHHAMTDGKIKPDSYVTLCSVGGGYSMSGVLYKF